MSCSWCTSYSWSMSWWLASEPYFLYRAEGMEAMSASHFCHQQHVPDVVEIGNHFRRCHQKGELVVCVVGAPSSEMASDGGGRERRQHEEYFHSGSRHPFPYLRVQSRLLLPVILLVRSCSLQSKTSLMSSPTAATTGGIGPSTRYDWRGTGGTNCRADSSSSLPVDSRNR